VNPADHVRRLGYSPGDRMPETPPLIMVVDDLVDHRELLSQVLVDFGYAVETADDARRALEAVRSGARPRLVLVDFWMPGMDGREFLSALRADADDAVRRIPVVVMTADADGVAEILSASPPDLLLEKPFGLRELRRVVVRFCGQGAAGARLAGAPRQDPV
jgi:two-component system, NarL family, sensor histidine kinase EvgS